MMTQEGPSLHVLQAACLSLLTFDQCCITLGKGLVNRRSFKNLLANFQGGNGYRREAGMVRRLSRQGCVHALCSWHSQGSSQPSLILSPGDECLLASEGLRHIQYANTHAGSTFIHVKQKKKPKQSNKNMQTTTEQVGQWPGWGLNPRMLLA